MDAFALAFASKALANGKEREFAPAIEGVDVAFLACMLRDGLVQEVHEKEQIMLGIVFVLHVIFKPMGRTAEWKQFGPIGAFEMKVHKDLSLAEPIQPLSSKCLRHHRRAANCLQRNKGRVPIYIPVKILARQTANKALVLVFLFDGIHTIT